MLLHQILLKDGDKKMMRLANADGKVWIVPMQDIKTGLDLYQPSGWKGRWLKRLLPFVGKWKVVRQLLHFETFEGRLSPTLVDAITQTFGSGNFEYSIFGGTPGARQKVTIQVFQGHRILGYVKVTDQTDVADSFLHEAQLLKDLKQKGVKGIPEALACGETTDGLHYFAQTTTKSRHSTYPHQWTAQHETFVAQLHDATKTVLRYEETDFFRMMHVLRDRMGWLNDKQQRIVQQTLEVAEKPLLGKTVEWSAYHGDFTPWNMFVEGGELFVFDWEYALRTFPPHLDRYHYLTQTLFFENHCSADDIFAFFKKCDNHFDKNHYLCYLLATISIYLSRESDQSGVERIVMMDIWTRILYLLLQDV